MAALEQVTQRPNACCNEPANLTRTQIAADRYKETCTCGRNHYVLEVDATHYGLSLSPAAA